LCKGKAIYVLGADGGALEWCAASIRSIDEQVFGTLSTLSVTKGRDQGVGWGGVGGKSLISQQQQQQEEENQQEKKTPHDYMASVDMRSD
jgi:hypothetical protein